MKNKDTQKRQYNRYIFKIKLFYKRSMHRKYNLPTLYGNESKDLAQYKN